MSVRDIRSDPDIGGGADVGEPSLPCFVRSLREKGVALSLDETGQRLSYRAPRGALSGDDKAALLSRREEVLRFMRARAMATRPPLKHGGNGAVPSLTQEFLWRSARGSPTQNGERRIPLFLPFRARPAAAVQAAIEAVIARHEALRYSFRESGGTLQAVINDPAAFRVETERLAVSCSFLRGDMPAAVAEFAAGVPELQGEWLTRARVFLEPGGEGLIVLIFHHIIGDGTSLGVIADELTSLLASPLEDLPAAPFQFSDFAAWEREWFRGEAAERLAAFWVDWLATVPSLRLPATGAALEWARGDRVDYAFAFAGGALREFDRLARELRVTPFLLVLAVYSIALSRWSGQSRYAVLSVANGRAFPDTLTLRRTVGPIFHLDPIEVSLGGSAQPRDALRMLGTNYAAARELRFPINDCLPGLRVPEIIHRVGATINYRDMRPENSTPVSAAPAPAAPTPAAGAQPRDACRRPEPAPADRYDVPLQPLNLRIEHSATTLACRLEFNQSLVSRGEQQAVVGQLLGAFEELLFAR